MHGWLSSPVPKGLQPRSDCTGLLKWVSSVYKSSYGMWQLLLRLSARSSSAVDLLTTLECMQAYMQPWCVRGSEILVLYPIVLLVSLICLGPATNNIQCVHGRTLNDTILTLTSPSSMNNLPAHTPFSQLTFQSYTLPLLPELFHSNIKCPL